MLYMAARLRTNWTSLGLESCWCLFVSDACRTMPRSRSEAHPITSATDISLATYTPRTISRVQFQTFQMLHPLSADTKFKESQNMLDHCARQSALGRLEKSQQGSEFRCSWRTRLSHTHFHYVSYTFQSPPCSLCLLMLPLPISHLIAPRSHSTRPSLMLLAARKKGSHKSNTFDLPSEPTISMHASKYMQLFLSPSPRKGFTTLQGAMEVDLSPPPSQAFKTPLAGRIDHQGRSAAHC